MNMKLYRKIVALLLAAALVVPVMLPVQAKSSSEIQKEIPNCADVTNQRISALLRQMIEDGLVVRTEDKRKAFFSLA